MTMIMATLAEPPGSGCAGAEGAAMSERESCGSCRFFVTEDTAHSQDRDHVGSCHRYPPAWFGEYPTYPEVCQRDWCGEWRTVGEPAHAVTVSNLGTSARVRNCMEAENIITVAQLMEWQPHQLLELRNFGETSLLEVRKALGKLGLSLRGDAVYS